MAIPTSKPLSLSKVQTEYGGSNPISMSEYRGKGNAPASGPIILWQHFNGTSNRVAITATGGVKTTANGYTYHTFDSGVGNNNQTFQITSGLDPVEYIVIGNGGIGGAGGGVVVGSETLGAGSYPMYLSDTWSNNNTTFRGKTAGPGGGDYGATSGAPQSNPGGAFYSDGGVSYFASAYGGAGGAGGAGTDGTGYQTYGARGGNGGPGYLWLDGKRYGAGGGGPGLAPADSDYEGVNGYLHIDGVGGAGNGNYGSGANGRSAVIVRYLSA